MAGNEKRTEHIGRIILANFLEYSLQKFINFIQAVEELPLYNKLVDEGIIVCQTFADAEILDKGQKAVSVHCEDGVIAKIRKNMNYNFSICYTRREFSIEYIVDEDKLQKIIDPVGNCIGRALPCAITISRKSMPITKSDMQPHNDQSGKSSNQNDRIISNRVKTSKEEIKKIIGFLHKLRRISTRNRITHRILEEIVKYQQAYFESNNELDLNLLGRAELAGIISNTDLPALKTGMPAVCKKSDSSHSLIMDTSRITRVIKGISIITPQGKAVSLKDLFPSKRDLVKKHIKVILNKEKEDIYNRRVGKPYTDEELRCKLNDGSITRREIAYCRKDMGVLPYSKRLNSYGYPPFSANFSKIHPFTVTSVKNNSPACPGVYELRLAEGMIEYPGGACQTFYIGSAKNLRKRLRDHLGSNGKNGGIKKFLERNRCVFRYIRFSPVGKTCPSALEWVREEKNLYDLFITTFGDSPVCNHVSPKACES